MHPGDGALTAKSGNNVLGQQGLNTGPAHTLECSTALSTLSLYAAGWNDGNGASGLPIAQFSASAYGADNTLLASVG